MGIAFFTRYKNRFRIFSGAGSFSLVFYALSRYDSNHFYLRKRIVTLVGLRLGELIVLAIGLSMDALAVSICKGLALPRAGWKECCIAGLWFGAFQALMPLLGYFLGTQFEALITAVDHWIAFGLLLLIGGNMIREALSREEEAQSPSMGFRVMLPLAVATSIDALAVGITFAFLVERIVPAVCLIGVITFLFSAAGVKLGNVFGTKYKSKAEFAGGVILILLGTKILLDHLGVL